MSLRNKIVIIFGGTGVLCSELGEGLTAYGAICILVGRNETKIREKVENNENLHFIYCDVTSSSDINALFEQVYGEYKRIDVVINGAGANSQTPYMSITEEEITRIMNTNLRSAILSCQAAGKIMIESGGGCIINIGSVSGIIPLSKVFVYSCSKAALHNLSKNLAREWGQYNIRVNTLIPGFFPAEQNRKILTEERKSKIIEHTPLGRFGEPKELIEPVHMMCVSSFMTGTELVIDGGFSCNTI